MRKSVLFLILFVVLLAGLVAVVVELNLVNDRYPILPLEITTPVCAGCPACVAPSTPVPTPTPAALWPTPLPPPAVGTPNWTDDEITQVLAEDARVRNGDLEGDTELHFTPDFSLHTFTASQRLLSVLYTDDPQDRQPVVVVVEIGKTTAWVMKRPEPGRYQIFPWELEYVPAEVMDLLSAGSVDGDMRFVIRYTVLGMGELVLVRGIGILFPLG